MKKIEKPIEAAWKTFERMCLPVFEKEFNARAKFRGKPGIGQNGIDIHMRCLYTKPGAHQARDTVIVIQCKAYQTVHWSTFSSDFKDAVNAFAPKQTSDPDLLFVLATTADGVNDGDIAEKAQLLLDDPEQIDQRIDTSRVAHQEICWPTIERIIEDNDSLQKLFIAPSWPADDTHNKELDDLRSDMTRLALKRYWASMRKMLDDYRAAKNIGRTEFDWVPRNLMKDMAEMFLQAADFEPALALLRHAVSLHPIDAFYRLGYLRSYRFLKNFPHDSRPLQWFGGFQPTAHRPYLQRTLENEVDQTAQAMLAARGTPDECLTLVLWVLSYTTSKETADLALSRAHDQLIQEWPDDVPRLQLDDIYTATEDGYIENATYPCSTGPHSIHAHRVAAALSAVFTYLCILHEQRFLGDCTANPREREVQWPIIERLTDQDLRAYFRNMDDTLKLVLRHHFPRFWNEASGRDASWLSFRTAYKVPRATLEERRYVVSSIFLLRDCVAGETELRLRAIKEAAQIYSQKYLITSNADLEHIALIMRSLQIQVGNKGVSEQDTAAQLSQLENLVGHIVRTEYRNMTETAAPMRSVPVYFDGHEPGYERAPALDLSQEHDIPFIAATPGEYRLAQQRHLFPELVHDYFFPLVYHTIT